MLAQKMTDDTGIRCYTNTYYDFCPLPFYADYNDYGAGENNSGLGLPVIMTAIRNKLFEYDQGENQYHDIAVRKEGFDVEKMWEAAHEGRLALNNSRNQTFLGMMLNSTSDPLEKADIAAKLADIQRFGRRIAPVMVHGDILDHILDNVTKEYYYYDEERNFVTETYYFHELVADLPEFVMRMRCAIAGDDFFSFEDSARKLFEDDERNLATKWLSGIDRQAEFLFRMDDMMREGTEQLSDEELVAFLTEYLKGLWLNSYMDSIHRAWIVPMSAGQEIDHEPYQILNNAIQAVFAKERREYYMDEDEDEDEEEIN